MSVLANGETTFYHDDYLGSISHITNEYGEVEQSFRYRAFGERLFENKQNGAWLPDSLMEEKPYGFTDYGFTGRTHDTDTGLMDYRSRQYDPSIGRFIQADSYPSNIMYEDGGNALVSVPQIDVYAVHNLVKENYSPENPDLRYRDFSEASAVDIVGTPLNYKIFSKLYEPDIFNAYGYCDDAPVLKTDPWGRNAAILSPKGLFMAGLLALMMAKSLEEALSRVKPYTIPRDDKEKWEPRVRLQAQGGKKKSLQIEKSIVLWGSNTFPVKADIALLALGSLASELTDSEYMERADAFKEATAWILSIKAIGGILGFDSKSFPRQPKGDTKQARTIRVDVEVLRGRNLVP